MSPELIPHEVEAIIFDCDGTLLDTMPLHWQAWCAVCDETGLKFSEEDFYALAGVPGKTIIRDYAIKQGIEFDPRQVYDRKRAHFLKGLSSAKTIPSVVKFAQEAYKEGIPIAVASGSSRSQVEKALTVAGIHAMFDSILGNEDYQRPKPNPDAFLTAAEKLNATPDKCWAFEDSDIGLEAIKKAGFARAVDVRLFEGYPRRLSSSG